MPFPSDSNNLQTEKRLADKLVRLTLDINRYVSNLDQMLHASLESIQNILGGTWGFLVLIDPSNHTATLTNAVGLGDDLIAELKRLKCEHAAPPHFADIYPAFSMPILGNAIDQILASHNLRSFVSIPLVTSSAPIGLLIVDKSASLVPDAPSIDLLMAIGEQIGRAVENMRLLAQLRESEKWSRAFIESCPDGFIERDASDRITFANQGACRILECSHGELVGSKMADYLYDQEALAAYSAQLMRDGIVVGCNLPARAKTGKGIMINGTSRPIKNSNGEIIAVQTIFRDVTEHQNFAETLKRQNEALTALNSIAEVLSHPLEIIQALNQVCEKLTLITHMESVGITLNDQAETTTSLVAFHGLGAALRKAFARVGLDDPATRHIAVDGIVAAINDVSQFPGDGFADARKEGFHAVILVPVLRHDKPIGILGAGSRTLNAYDQSDVDLLMNVGRQIGTALENADLYTQMQSRLKELDGLAQLSAACASTLELERICKFAVRWTHDLTHADMCTLRLIQDDHLVITAISPSSQEPPIGQSSLLDTFLKRRLEEPEPFISNNLELDTQTPEAFRNQTLQKGLQAIVIMPITSRNRALGFLIVLHAHPYVWQPSEIDLIKTIANQISSAIDNADLYKQLNKRVEELDGLAHLSAACASTLDPVAVARWVTEQTADLMHSDACALRRIENDHWILEASHINQGVDLLEECVPIHPMFQPLIQTQEPVILHNVESANGIDEFARTHFLRRGIHAMIIVPVIVRNQTIGGLSVMQAQPRQWSTAEIDLLKTIANQVSNAIHNAQLFNKILSEQRKVQAIFDSGLSGLFVTDAEGRIVMFNRAAERITGWTFDQVYGKKYEETMADPISASSAEPLINEALVRKQTVFVQEGRSIQTHDGRIIPTAQAVAPLLDDQNNVVGVVGAFWDLTREQSAALSQKQFLTHVAHQMRSPLTAMLSAIEMLENSKLPKAQRKELWQVIQRDAERLRTFANQFLDQQSLLGEGRKFHLEPLSITIVARDLITQLKASANKHHFQIDCMTPEPTVLADAIAVQDVLRNLLDNAVQYSPAGTTISLCIEPQNSDMIDISVRDQGHGIPFEDIERVFQPFYRSDKMNALRSHYSHGLGLSIAKQAVEHMGGKIWVDPDTSLGTTVHFTLRRTA